VAAVRLGYSSRLFRRLWRFLVADVGVLLLGTIENVRRFRDRFGVDQGP